MAALTGKVRISSVAQAKGRTRPEGATHKNGPQSEAHIRDMTVSALPLLDAEICGQQRPERKPWCRHPPVVPDD